MRRRFTPINANETVDPDPRDAQTGDPSDELAKTLNEGLGVNIGEVNTDELIRIEETLAIAMKAAKQAVSVRLRRREQRRDQPQASAATPTSDSADGAPRVVDRIFDDMRGKRWHAYAVHPSGRAALPEAFRNGWLTFESADEMRRIAPIPENWEALSIEDLRLLCHRADRAPKRVKSPDEARAAKTESP